jgi:hypothetical protein
MDLRLELGIDILSELNLRQLPATDFPYREFFSGPCILGGLFVPLFVILSPLSHGVMAHLELNFALAVAFLRL